MVRSQKQVMKTVDETIEDSDMEEVEEDEEDSDGEEDASIVAGPSKVSYTLNFLQSLVSIFEFHLHFEFFYNPSYLSLSFGYILNFFTTLVSIFEFRLL